MPVTANVRQLDQDIQFLRNEAARLRAHRESWAIDKANRLEAIAETLRELRQDKQMSGLGGKRLEG